MFSKIKAQVQSRFAEILKDNGVLFRVDVDREKVWDTYLAAFSEEKRAENSCNCCKSFIRQYGGIVGIKNNKMVTLWDFETDDEEYANPIKALGDYVRSLPVSGIFLNPFKKCGTEKNADSKRGVIWEHFYVELPTKFVKNEPGATEGAARDNKNVLKRSLKEITDDAVDTVLELISQNSIYRGQEFEGLVKEFNKIKIQYNKLKNKQHKENFCWTNSGNGAVSRIKNSAIGTLLNNLSEGMELDKAVAAFERVVAPSNYKRPTALATPKMIEAAKTRLEELGLIGSLHRRLLDSKDLTVDNTIFVNRPTSKSVDIFDELKKDVTVNPKTLSKVEEISIRDLVEKVLPTSKSVKVLVENQHMGNFVSLVGPKEKDDNTLFKWGNNFSWSYSGEVADSIKERVKNAGGKVDGVLRVSLSWNNNDDLDLHLIEPRGYKVYYPDRRTESPSGAVLDIDANGADGIVPNPVENIYWTNLPKQEGEYKVIVNQFARRQNTNSGFELELEFNGEIHNFSFPDNGQSRHDHKVLTFKYTKKDGVVIVGGGGKVGSYQSKEKWGIKTGQFHKVRAITLSPNYWNAEVGNRHYFFFLEGCKTDEKVRGFYNEFLKEDLSKDRKVFEILGNKVTVESSEDELSGVGFSDTVRNHLYVEVEGKFKRVLKVKI